MKNPILNLSINNKLKLIMLISASLAALLSMTLTVLTGVRSMYSEYLEEISGTTQILASRNAAALAFHDADSATQNLKILTEKANIVRACIFDIDGGLFAQYSTNVPDSQCAIDPTKWNGTFAEYNIVRDGYVRTVKNVYSNGEVVGAISVISTTAHLTAQIYRQIFTAILTMSVALGVVYFIIGKLQRTVSRPLLQVIESTKAISEGRETSALAQYQYKDELQTLVEAINKIVTVRQTMTAEHAMKLQNILRGYRNALGLLDYLKNTFQERTVKSLEGVVDIMNKRSLGDELNEYMPYLNDLSEEIQVHYSDVEALEQISKIYERSIGQARTEVDLNKAISQYFSPLAETYSSFKNVKIEIRTLPTWSVYEESFLKTIQISVNLLACVLSHYFDSSDISLTCESNIETCVTLTLHCGNQASVTAKLGLVSEEDSPWFIEDGVINSEDFKFLLNSMKYLGSANHISVHHKIRGQTFIIKFDKDHLNYGGQYYFM